MTTVADLVQETRRQLMGLHRALWNRLDTAIADAVTPTVVLEFDASAQVAKGAIISIDDELMYVFAVSANSLTVQRGWYGTTATTHADGALVEVQPRFPQYQIRKALTDEIRSWPAEMFRVAGLTIPVTDSNIRGYDLTDLGTFYNVLDVRRAPRSFSGSADDTASSSRSWARVRFSTTRVLDTGDFASGIALTLGELVEGSVRVIASTPFVTTIMTDATDVEATIGLSASMVDIPPVGAAARLLYPREVQRTGTQEQGEVRDAQEVPPGFITQTATALWGFRRTRLSEEINRLRTFYPITAF